MQFNNIDRDLSQAQRHRPRELVVDHSLIDFRRVFYVTNYCELLEIIIVAQLCVWIWFDGGVSTLTDWLQPANKVDAIHSAK